MKKIKEIIPTTLLTFIILTASANAAEFACQADEIVEFGARIHVRCANSYELASGDDIRYIAIGKDDIAKANRFTSLGTTAVVSGYIFYVKMPEESDSNVPGCQTNDCRTPSAFGIRY